MALCSCFINVYLTDEPYNSADVNSKYPKYIKELTEKNRLKKYSKVDVFKLFIHSLRHLNFENFYIYYELGSDYSQNYYSDIDVFIKSTLGSDLISIAHKRIVGKKSFMNVIDQIESSGVERVFYSPNHDHIFIGNPLYFNELISIYCNAKYSPDVKNVSLVYSHHYEWLNVSNFLSPLYDHQNCYISSREGEGNKKFKVAKFNKAIFDSVQIFQTKLLRNLIDSSLISDFRRLEDLTDCLYETYMDYELIIPNKELFRHFDSYFHLDLDVNNGDYYLDYMPQFLLKGSNIQSFDDALNDATRYHSVLDGLVRNSGAWPSLSVFIIIINNIKKLLYRVRAKMMGSEK